VQRVPRLAQQDWDRVLALDSQRALLQEVRVASVVTREVSLLCGVESAMVLMVSAIVTSSASGKSRHDRDASGSAKADAECHRLHGEENRTNPSDGEVLNRHESATTGSDEGSVNSNLSISKGDRANR
jgi:hypothetical protein